MWSVKGKKIPVYRVSEKKIVISPKKSMNGKFLATLGLTSLVALGLKLLYPSVGSGSSVTQDIYYSTAESAKTAVASAPSVSPDQILASSPVPEIWLWFLLGGIFSLLSIADWKSVCT